MRARAARLFASTSGFVLAALVAACQPVPAGLPSGPPPPRQTTTSLDLETARATLAERLRGEGFSVERDVGGLRVRATDPRFMRCPVVQVRSLDRDSSKRQSARADRTITTVTIRVEEAGRRTSLSWQPTFTGSYLNRIENLRFERACASTGVVEQLLSTALPN